MKLIKLDLVSKNNIQRGKWWYMPIILLDGKYYRCKVIKATRPLKCKDVDIATLQTTSEIKPEHYQANGLLKIATI